jgi:hypothetical protein
MLVALLLLILAAVVAGPIGFFAVGICLLVWAILAGSIHLVFDILLLPFRMIGALTGRDRPRL